MTENLLLLIAINCLLWAVFPKYRLRGVGILGSLLTMGDAARAAERRRAELREIANTPGLDVEATNREAIGIGSSLLPDATQLAGDINKAGVSSVDAAIPGYAGQLQKRSGVIDDWLSGQLPDDVVNQIQSSGAARSFGGGYSGSGLHRNLEARDLGLNSLDLIMRGMSAADSFNQNTMSLINPRGVGVADYIPTGEDLTNIRGNEREQRIATLVGATNAPSSEEVRLRAIQNIEQQVAEMIGGATGAMACWVAREVYGQENRKWVFFRNWLFTEGPRWLRELYMECGQRFAGWIANKPILKRCIRKLMDRAIGE